MSPSDDEDWAQLLRGIKPLSPSARLPKPPSRKELRIRPRPIPTPDPLFTPPSSTLSPGQSVDIDKSTLQKLKQGKYPIESRLDLHGYTQDKAYETLSRFVMQNYQEGKRCVLVVTGKGQKPDGSPGVIRHQVPLWLNTDLRRYVLAFAYAKIKDGGEGALYVLLRRARG